MFDYLKSKLGKNQVIAGIYNRIMHPPLSEQQFKEEFDQFSTLSQLKQQRFLLQWNDRYPCLQDRTTETDFNRHYVYHVAWAARILAKIMPDSHVDISSSINFCSVVSAFIPVQFYDLRPVSLHLSNLKTGYANLMSLPFENDSIPSLSCMHVIEHIGLGRYGDTIDPDADLVAMNELLRILAPEGNLLFVVPIGGVPKIMFNAHRIYSYDQVLGFFDTLELVSFSLIPDYPGTNGFLDIASKADADKCEYGCGCFQFRKK
jgi:SAM-dependent methyltransferase